MGKYANLGWRIILESDPLERKEGIIKKTRGKALHSILPTRYCEKHLDALEVFRKAQNDKKITSKEENFFEDVTGVRPDNIINYDSEESSTGIDNEEGISIKLATYVGCKGLSAGFVFIVGMNEGVLPKDNSNPTNEEIKKFIVSLTRTVKKCYLVTTDWFGSQHRGDKSIFIDWIKDQRLQKVDVSKDYWS